MVSSPDPFSPALQGLPLPQSNQPGFALALWRPHQPPAFLCKGVSRIGGDAINPRTMFDLASVSKMFTALALHLAAARHGFTQDTRLADLLPEMHKVAPKVVIRHLLHHLSSLPDYMDLFQGKGLGQQDRLGMDETLLILSRQPEAPAPEQRFRYSNTGYVLLSAIIERVTGMSTARFIHEQIFAPLGMRATTLIDRMPPALPHLAQSYSGGDGTEINPLWEMTGDGQIYSNLEDMGLWAAQLLSPRLFGDALTELLTPPVSAALGDLDYGNGIQHMRFCGEPAFGHDGGWAGFSSDLLLLPGRQTACLALVNRGDLSASSLCRAVMQHHLEKSVRTGHM